MGNDSKNIKSESVGKVVLDLSFYPGEDFYCDGDIEDEILDIVKTHSKDQFGQIIEERNCWEVLYHLSPLRGNIVEWLPMKSTDKVLEVGSGCGAITGTLAAKCGELTCIDLSKKRSLINAYRNQDCDNVTIKVGNFQDIEPSLDTDYDYICLIGVYEYAAAYINHQDPYGQFLEIIRKHLKKGGHIIIAIENRMGLKYLAGCPEDHLGKYFTGIEDYPAGGVVRTFTRPALEQILEKSGIERYSFYYPYPDYKFMHTLFSDERLPKSGELTTNLRNLDRDRILLFDEKNAFDSILKDGTFPLFSNSYLLVIGDDFNLAYSKYSNDRDQKYAIRTDCVIDEGGIRYRKAALNEESKKHLEKIHNDGKTLAKRYEGCDLYICPSDFEDDGCLYFPYLEGETLEKVIDANPACLKDVIEKLNSYLIFNDEYGIWDYDMIFPNIIVDSNNQWKLIDYEWSQNEAIDASEIIKRALFCYRLGSEKRKAIDVQTILREIGIEEYDEEKLMEEELAFQARVTGNRKSLSQLRDSINYEVLPLVNAIERHKLQESIKLAQIYPFGETGYSEETSFYIKPVIVNQNENIIEIKLSNAKQVRIDPAKFESLVCIKECYVNQTNGAIEQYPIKRLVSNGKKVSMDTFAFNHEDPNLIFSWKKPVDGTLVVKYEITELSDSIANSICGK